MPQGWSKKDERQYAHIKDSQKARGVSDKRAAEVAARTVNKTRREHGETPNKRTQGTGNPYKPLRERTKAELENRAKGLKIRGRSRMTKADLVDAIQHAQS